ncbi:MAG: L-serine ammonia-lyase, iron-sulfur-dependent, subunit beta [Firmicutes bacterium]|nr:L-serine ammonia-lyase, iron-sulfur-dependent, subunit beta [Bacillota bacterium]
MTYTSIFDVIGPNMIGPSSSHTAGAVAIALMARKLFIRPGSADPAGNVDPAGRSIPSGRQIARADFTLYGSFAKTYRGHGTDKALLGGIQGFTPDDIRIRDAFSIADRTGLAYSFTENHENLGYHPNTADILLTGTDGSRQFVRGVSTGGGRMKIIRINNIDVDFTGQYSTLIVRQKDTAGIIAHISRCLSEKNVNIAFMRLYREAKGQTAYTIIESDQAIPPAIIDSINACDDIFETTVIQV